MTPEQNALLARLDGVELIQYGEQSWRLNCDEYVEAPDYDDERILMPLAFTYGAHKSAIFTAAEIGYAAYKRAMQDHLLAIAREQFNET